MTSPLFARGVPATKDGGLSGNPLVDQGKHMHILSRRIAPVTGDALVAYYWFSIVAYYWFSIVAYYWFSIDRRTKLGVAGAAAAA